jgi:predicted SnoaL-like aldol condensation-catalyzing enzyme
MTSFKKISICNLLKGIETGDAKSVMVVNEDRYIQHNPQTSEGSEGLAALFERLSKTNPTVNIVRVFEDGDYVFAHTEYNFDSSNIGFEIFRFEDGLAVEHWDNIQPKQGPNPSGHTMVGGPTEATDLERTEDNRAMVKSFVDNVLIGRQHELLEHFIDAECYTEHDPGIANGLPGLRLALVGGNGDIPSLEYSRNHRVLAEGCFVLAVCDGIHSGAYSAFYDLYRVADGRLVEHWNTIEAIPPRNEWKNDNGKF